MIMLAVYAVLLFLYSLGSARLQRTVLTAPLLFTGAGMVTFLVLADLRAWRDRHDLFLWLAEVGLVMTLFGDASRTDLGILRKSGNLPARLLSVGMVLTLFLGAVAALLVFAHLSLWEAAILSAILAPTDAGLGQVIVTSSRVPPRVREALSVEAGLNDGLSVPFLLFFIALAVARSSGHGGSLPTLVGQQLGYGALVGFSIGLGGGGLLGLAARRGWMAGSLQQLGVVTLPLLCLMASRPVGASMFIAAFVAGLAVQFGFRDAGRHAIEFTEEWGQFLNLLVFFLFGAVAMEAWRQFDGASVLYAVLSLTVVRMLPVAIALAGTRLGRATVLFMGWFGPRGLASIVLGLVYLEQEARLPGEPTMRIAVIVTVLLSVFAHGLSALPGIDVYSRLVGARETSAAEGSPKEEPSRG